MLCGAHPVDPPHTGPLTDARLSNASVNDWGDASRDSTSNASSTLDFPELLRPIKIVKSDSGTVTSRNDLKSVSCNDAINGVATGISV